MVVGLMTGFLLANSTLTIRLIGTCSQSTTGVAGRSDKEYMSISDGRESKTTDSLAFHVKSVAPVADHEQTLGIRFHLYSDAERRGAIYSGQIDFTTIDRSIWSHYTSLGVEL